MIYARVISTGEQGMCICGRTVGKYTFPATPGKGGGEVCFVWGLVITKPDLGSKATSVSE